MILDLLQRIPTWFWILLVAHFTVLGTVAYLILLERKVAAWAQDRLGPNRVGPLGLLQPIADGLKFILKEDYRPAGVDKVLFTIAPAVMILVVIISIAVIPWGGVHRTSKTIDVTGTADVQAKVNEYLPGNAKIVGDVKIEETAPTYAAPGVVAQPAQKLATVTYEYPFQIAKLNIGVLYVLAILSLAVYGVVIGGWASNNKYSFLGGLRATANMISYEIPLGLAVIAIVVMFGTLDLGDIVDKQATYWAGFVPAWNVFAQPLVFVMFLICIHAEANRAPFDTAEAEQELVGGYHTEYSAMRFALFFLAEYAEMITMSAVCVALFFGGWHLPWLEWVIPGFAPVDPGNPSVTDHLWVAIVRSLVFYGKVLAVVYIFMWTRWSLPRFRFDQIMQLAWRALIPISLAMMVATAVVVWYFGGERAHMRVTGKMALVLLLVNVGILAITMILSVVIPPAPDTNRRIKVAGSRFDKTPLPATT